MLGSTTIYVIYVTVFQSADFQEIVCIKDSGLNSLVMCKVRIGTFPVLLILIFVLFVVVDVGNNIKVSTRIHAARWLAVL